MNKPKTDRLADAQAQAWRRATDACIALLDAVVEKGDVFDADPLKIGKELAALRNAIWKLGERGPK
jgi:hypothetical protein